MYDLDIVLPLVNAEGGFPKCFDSKSVKQLIKDRDTFIHLIEAHQEAINEYNKYVTYITQLGSRKVMKEAYYRSNFSGSNNEEESPIN